MNEGERDEFIFKILLTKRRDEGGELFGVKIQRVGFGNVLIPNDYLEYGSIPNNFDINSLKELSDDSLKDFANSLGIDKALPKAKADIYINNVGISLKSLRSSPPALVNHTSRPGFEFACNNKNISIGELDEIINDYWRLRIDGIIGEDTCISDSNCPFKYHKEYLKPILDYFLFVDTGSGLSKYPAVYLIEFSDPFNYLTYKKLTAADAVEECWNKLIFSLRAKKGMPKNYNPDTYSGKNCDSISKWVQFINGDYRGALHIRQK